MLKKVTDKMKGGGISKLQIKDNGGTRTVMDPGLMVDALCDHYVKHYGQANHTIFRHGEYRDLLTADPMSNPVYDEFLDGTFAGLEHLPNCMEGKHIFIKHTKSTPPLAHGLEDELKAIAEMIVIKEWRRFFSDSKRKNNHQYH